MASPSGKEANFIPPMYHPDEDVTTYISDQAEHDRKFSYQEELRELLKRHRVAFDERYLWE